MDSAPIFSYSPLTDASKEIRLLRILPATGSDHDNVVAVNLDHFRKENSLVYDTLSYTWGDASKTRTILVDGSRFEATENLHAALVQLREFKPREDYHRNELIWINEVFVTRFARI
jgi:hypothetical protein